MNRLLFVLFFLTLSYPLFAQKEIKYVFRIDSFDAAEKIQLPFSAIKIIDTRFDQKNIGCVIKDLSFKGITQYKMLAVFPEETTTYLPKLFSHIVTLDKNQPDTLLILLKQFRLVDHIGNSTNSAYEPETVLSISCSFYRNDKDRITKISSLDEVISEEWIEDDIKGKNSLAAKRSDATMKLLQSIFQDRQWSPTSSSFPISDMEIAIKKRLQMPAFTSALTAGIYKNFDEFKNNSPSVSEFKIGRWKDKEVKEVLDSEGNLLNPKNFWGLCDGKDRYVCFQGGIQRLLRVDNSFRFVFSRRESEVQLGQKPKTYVDIPNSNIGSIGLPLSLNFSRDFRPEFLYLNLENGTVHTEEIIGTLNVRKLRTKSH